MGLGELYISLLLLRSLTWQQTQFYAYCAQQRDPIACYDSRPSREDLQEYLFYGDDPPLNHSSDRFYHYQNPAPRPERTCPVHTPARYCY